jgi:spore germination cell wall hydrolase CwlJ-like protein
MKLAVLVVSLLAASVSGASACSFDSQVHTLALNMYHEARGEGPDGMQMVGEVTLNRVSNSAFPDTICDVVYQRSQFSWTTHLRDKTPSETESWELAQELALDLLTDELELFDNGATHFLNPSKLGRLPRWAVEFEVVGRIGNHVFYAKDI